MLFDRAPVLLGYCPASPSVPPTMLLVQTHVLLRSFRYATCTYRPRRAPPLSFRLCFREPRADKKFRLKGIRRGTVARVNHCHCDRP